MQFINVLFLCRVLARFQTCRLTFQWLRAVCREVAPRSGMIFFILIFCFSYCLFKPIIGVFVALELVLRRLEVSCACRSESQWVYRLLLLR